MRFHRLIIAPVAVLGMLAFTGTPAQATVRNQIGSFGPTGPGTGGFTRPQSIAVEQSTGDIYVYNVNGREASVYKFDAEGKPKEIGSTGSNVIGPFNVTGGLDEGQIAIDNSTTSPNKGDIYIANFHLEEVDIYNPAGAKLASLETEEEVCGVAVDPGGNLYTSMPFASAANRISKYEPLSSPIEPKDFAGGLEVEEAKFCDIAADTAGDIYAAGFAGVAGVVKYEASQFDTPSPTGVVIDSNPGAATLAVDPESGEVYVDEQSDVAVYTSGGTEIEEFGTGLLSESYGVAVSDASGHVGDAYASACKEECEVVIFGPPSSGPTKFPLKVEKEGTGADEGKVTSNPAGITCGTGAECTHEFEEGEKVTLTATEEPDATATFTKWTGCEAEPSATECEVTMTAAKTVKAEFTAATPAEFPVTITSISGEGEVKGTMIACTPGGIGTASCTEEAKVGMTVKLTETPKAGYAFKEWTGKECAGSTSSTCEFTIPSEAVDEQAVFVASTKSPLTVFVTGEGTITSNPAGITNCGPLGGVECTHEFEGTVTLTGKAVTGYVLVGWIGCKKTTATECTVDVTAPSEVTAVFLKEGEKGEKGATGSTGSQGAPGLNGEQGEKGVTGTNGTNGQNGVPGPGGLQGPTGPTGGQGPAGAAGPAGPAGQVQLVTCKTVRKGKKSAQQCTTKLVSGTVKFTSAGASSAAQATLSRHGMVYAAGMARVASGGGGRTSLRLLSVRKLAPGKYKLTLISGAGRHERIRSESFTLR